MKLFIYNSKYLISICFTQYFLDKRISRYVHRQLCRQVLRLSDNGRKTYPHYHAPCYTQQQRPSLHSRINNFMEKMVGAREETTKHKNKQEVRFPKLTHRAAWANRIITNFASPYRTGTQKFHAPVWWESLCIFKNSETVWTTGIGKCTGENPFFQHNWLSQSLFQILPCWQIVNYLMQKQLFLIFPDNAEDWHFYGLMQKSAFLGPSKLLLEVTRLQTPVWRRECTGLASATQANEAKGRKRAGI